MNAPKGMTCPIDGATLVMSERQGIEIDYCPTCRGVWLDRGELDKIIERSATAEAPQQGRHYDDRHASYGRDHYHHGKKRKSFLHELFD
jgi:Zn-finger nucleic acid-binding protein